MSNLTQPPHTALRLGAIHKKPSVSNRMYVVRGLSSSTWAKANGLGLITLHGYDHYELILCGAGSCDWGYPVSQVSVSMPAPKYLTDIHPSNIFGGLHPLDN